MAMVAGSQEAVRLPETHQVASLLLVLKLDNSYPRFETPTVHPNGIAGREQSFSN